MKFSLNKKADNLWVFVCLDWWEGGGFWVSFLNIFLWVLY
jgi:hypothetical protein